LKTLIIYTTKNGSVEKAANMLKTKLNHEVQLINLMVEEPPSLGQYDTIILGGSIYMGKIQKKLTKYMENHLPELTTKRIGLFICAGHPKSDIRKKELEEAFPKSLYEKAIVKEILGDEIHLEKLNFVEKWMIKTVKGSELNSSNLSKDKIVWFAKRILNH
jgi:menaquinone-dependent protoporphyrinogen oxidase